MRTRKKHILFRNQVATILKEQQAKHEKNPNEPLGLSTMQISDKMVDNGKHRLMPPRNTMGGKISKVIGVLPIGQTTTGTMYSRKHTVWTIDYEAYCEWRDA